MKDGFTRKEFLDTTARSAVAVSLGVFGGSLVARASAQERQVPITANVASQSYPWPWPYTRLDPEDIRKRAHKGYYDGGCGYGAFHGLVSALADAIGAPFTVVPSQMLYFGGGGGAGWGTLCGALNGAAAAMSLVVDWSNAASLISELFGWYTAVKLPTDISNDYAVRRVFLVNRNDKALTQTVSSTPLCHGSVSKWCTETRLRVTSPERAERCARLTGDTAARAVELLNDFAEGRFRAAFVPPKSVTECMTCHDQTAQGQVLSGVKMDCKQCHDDNWDHLW